MQSQSVKMLARPPHLHLDCVARALERLHRLVVRRPREVLAVHADYGVAHVQGALRGVRGHALEWRDFTQLVQEIQIPSSAQFFAS